MPKLETTHDDWVQIRFMLEDIHTVLFPKRLSGPSVHLSTDEGHVYITSEDEDEAILAKKLALQILRHRTHFYFEHIVYDGDRVCSEMVEGRMIYKCGFRVFINHDGF